MHDQGHEVGAVAAEVEHGAGAVLLRIREPAEEGWADADLFRPLVTIVYDNATDGAELTFIGLADCLCVAGVPGCLVVGEHLHVILASRLADGDGVGDVGGQRLLNHGADAALGGFFNDSAMILDVGVDEGHIGMELVKHLVGVRIEQLGIEMKLGRILGDQLLIGLGYADQLDILVFHQRVEKTKSVIMHEADNDHAHRSIGLDSLRLSQGSLGKRSKNQSERAYRREQHFSEHVRPQGCSGSAC